MTNSIPCPLCSHTASPFLQVQKSHKTYFLCATCDLCFLDPSEHLSKRDEELYYQSHENDIHDARYQQFVTPLVQKVREIVAPGSEGLDYGCGPGPVAAAMLEKDGYRLARYDPVFAPHAELLERQYDFIICSEVIEHFHRPREEFTRLQSLLKPNGSLVIMTSFRRKDVDFATWHYRRDPTHASFYSPTCFHWISMRFGFKKIWENGKNLAVLTT